MVPLKTADGSKILGYFPIDLFERFKDRYVLRYNRRGHLKAASEKPSMSLDARPDSTLGIGFEQHLSQGRCYALHGVIGSR